MWGSDRPLHSPAMRDAHAGRSLLAVFAAALVIAGCGGDGGGEAIPADEAEGLLAAVDDVQGEAQAGDCESAQAAAEELRDRVEALPGEVDDDTRGALEDASDRVNLLVGTEVCGGATGIEGQVDEETEPPPTEETAPEEKQEPPEPDEDEPPEQPKGEGRVDGPPGQEKKDGEDGTDSDGGTDGTGGTGPGGG